MKKGFIAVIGFVLISCSVPATEMDLSGMTYDQLVALKNQINLAMWNSQEWQEVTVPQGEWIVGEDIPAGHWTVKCVNYEDAREALVEWGFKDSDGKLQYETGGSAFLYNVNNEFYKEGSTTEIEVVLEDGMSFIVDIYWSPALFTPYAGKPDLGFK